MKQRGGALGTLFYAIVAVAALVGLLLVAFDHWRGGIGLMGGAMVAAGLVRVILPEGRAGWLRIRHRWGDATTMLVLGALLIVLAVAIPPQPPGS